MLISLNYQQSERCTVQWHEIISLQLGFPLAVDDWTELDYTGVYAGVIICDRFLLTLEFKSSKLRSSAT